MLNETGAGINPELALPMGRIRVPKFLYLVIIVLSVLILAVVGLNMYLRKSIDKMVRNKIVPVAVDKDRYCAYAKETLDWMDSKRDDKGKYYLDVFCDREKKECNQFEETGLSGHNDIPILWARYKYYLKNNDKQELIKVKRDIDVYFKQLDLMVVQNDFWNCRILAEMRDEKVLDVDYVSKINKLCESSTYLGTENMVGEYDENNVFKYKISANIPYLDWKNLSDEKLNQFKKDKSVKSSYVTYPSDFVARYKMWGKEEDLAFANNYFNQLLAESYLDKNKFLSADKCLLAISSLDLYSVNKDQKYLDWAKEIYNQYFSNEEIKPEGTNINCAFLNRELGKFDTNSLTYETNEKYLLDYFISKYWDGNNGAEKVSDEGGFLAIGGNSPLSKNIRENALMINLLCP